MDYSKLIHEYLDNEIDSTSEDLLFTELSRNNDLRSEFNTQLQIHLVAQNDIGTITPPIESTNMIFSSLGFNIPSTAFINTSSNLIKTSIWSNSVFKTFIISISAALLTGLVVYLMMNKESNDNNIFSSNNLNNIENSQKNVLEKNNNQILLTENKNVVSVSSIEKTNGTSKLDKKSSLNTNDNSNYKIKNTKSSNIKLNNKLNDNTENLNYESSSINNQELAINQENEKISNSIYNSLNKEFTKSELSEMKNGNTNSNISINKLSNFNKNNENLNLNLNQYLPNDFNLQLKSISSKSLNEINIPSSGNQLFNNLCFALTYNINEFHSIGVEIGQEQFSQSFYRTIDNQKYLFNQNPSLFWYGLKYSLNLPMISFSESLVPYTSVFAGGTISGALTKLQFGINYFVNNSISLNFGAEAGRLFYKVQNTNFNSDKVGFTYGINIHY